MVGNSTPRNQFPGLRRSGAPAGPRVNRELEFLEPDGAGSVWRFKDVGDV
jgi:hypothetical protein